MLIVFLEEGVEWSGCGVGQGGDAAGGVKG